MQCMGMAHCRRVLHAVAHIACIASMVLGSPIGEAPMDTASAGPPMPDHIVQSALHIFEAHYADMHPLVMKRDHTQACDRLRRRMHIIPGRIHAQQVLHAWAHPECIHRLTITMDL